MSTLTLMVGNIGSGKTIVSRKLARLGAVVVNMDTIQSMVSGGIYGRYDPDRKLLYKAIERTAIEHALAEGRDVVIDETNMDRARRKRFIEIGREFGAEIRVIDFGPGDERCIDRRRLDPRGISARTWASVYRKMWESYEEPDHGEGIDEIIKGPTRFVFHAFDFDGTIVENRFPDIGEPREATIREIRELYMQRDLSRVIIIWTCRAKESELLMQEWLEKNDVPYDYINDNPLFRTGSRKIFANVYHDDRNGG